MRTKSSVSIPLRPSCVPMTCWRYVVNCKLVLITPPCTNHDNEASKYLAYEKGSYIHKTGHSNRFQHRFSLSRLVWTDPPLWDIYANYCLGDYGRSDHCRNSCLLKKIEVGYRSWIFDIEPIPKSHPPSCGLKIILPHRTLPAQNVLRILQISKSKQPLQCPFQHSCSLQ